MEPSERRTLPHLSGRPVVTDGGLETDLIYHHGADLSACARTRRTEATRSSTPPPSWTRATPPTSPGPRTHCDLACRALPWSAGAAAPTPATSPPCGVSAADRVGMRESAGGRRA